jgi:hypothetical protein
MIPPLSPSGVLPPFLPSVGVTNPAAMAPYKTNLAEVASRFAVSPERNSILRGLLGYRQLLRSVGITEGFQWIDGSYVENCENIRGRAPKDIDIVTFAERPTSCADNYLWEQFVTQNSNTLFNRSTIKNQYLCDAFYEDLALPNKIIVNRARYWFGLFSHQRATYLWKGLLEISLQADDTIVLEQLDRGTGHAT